MLVVGIVGATVSTIRFRPVSPMPADIERFAAFAFTAAVFAAGYPGRRWRCLIAVVGLALLLELMQRLIPGRHGQPHDWFVKSLGAVAGVATVGLAEWLAARRGSPG